MLETRSTYRLVTRFSTGQRHSTCLKLSHCRASCGIYILRQLHCTRLKLRHGLSARVRKRTRLRNGSTAAEMLYSTPGKAVPPRPLGPRYRHSSPAARQHDAAVQKYHIYQRQHITTSTRQQTRSSITVHRQANDRQRHRLSSTAAQRQANDRQRLVSPAPAQQRHTQNKKPGQRSTAPRSSQKPQQCHEKAQHWHQKAGTSPLPHHLPVAERGADTRTDGEVGVVHGVEGHETGLGGVDLSAVVEH